VNVFFRVDESVQIGRGHMSRCCALAEVLLSIGANASFFCTEILSETRARLKLLGIKVVDLQDAMAFFNIGMCDEVVVVDGYHFDEYFWRQLLDKGPKRTVCIDDFRNVHYFADLVICYNEGIKPEQFSLDPGTRLLLGGRYLLLRPEIYASISRLDHHAITRGAVMVVAGGTNQEKWIIKMLSYLKLIEPFRIFWVLSGRSISPCRVAKQAGIRPGRLRVFSGLEPAHMLQLYRRSKYVISPASTMMLEAFVAGCPIISGWVAENQRNSLKFYSNKGLIANVGDMRNLSPSKLLWAKNIVRHRGGHMIRQQREYIASAKSGSKEIVEAIMSIDQKCCRSLAIDF